MKYSRVVLLVILLAIAGGMGVKDYLDQQEAAAQAVLRLKQQEVARAAAIEKAAKLAAEKAMEDTSVINAFSSAYPRPVSEWLEAEKATYEKLLSNAKSDVLIVPFQVMGWSFDQSTRALMGAEFTSAVAAAMNVTLPDPYLVAKALGDGERQFKKESVYRLADLLGAKRVIWGHAGHDRKGNMTVVLTSQQRVGTARSGVTWTGPMTTTKFERISIDEDVPPIVAFESRLPELVKSLGYGFTASPVPPVDARLDLHKLPDSPFGLLSKGENPARDAYAFLVYAALTPRYFEHTRNRFAEKAYLSLLRLAPTSPEYRALRARTLMHLGFRLAAIKALGEPSTSEEVALAAALNGSLPDVRSASDKEANSVKRLLQKLDANAIGVAYGLTNSKQSIEEANRLKLPGRIWPYLVTRAFVDKDDWSQFDNLAPKMILDQELPVKGYSLEEIVQGAASLGNMERIQAVVDGSVNVHVRKLLEADVPLHCCNADQDASRRLDYLALIAAVGDDNLIRRIRFHSRIQGNHRAAVLYAAGIDVIYRGHPYFTLELAKANNNLAEKLSPSERDLYRKDAYQLAFNAMYWARGQSYVASGASVEISRSGRNDHGRPENPYYTDIPFRPYYWTWSDGGSRTAVVANELAALKNATHEFEVVLKLNHTYRNILQDDVRAGELLTSIDGRFKGSPQKNELLAQEAKNRGESQLAEALWRDNIRVSPSYWQSYSDLGRMLFHAGDQQEAAKVFRAYPGFRSDSGSNRVGVANLSYEAGSHFYWTGNFSVAEQFYRLTLAQRTGAATEMIADGRMKLIAGDVTGAMASSLTRAQRYDSSTAYEDYLGMLHASGHAKEAWAGQNSLVREGRRAPVLGSALVGFRMAGADERAVIEWARRPDVQAAGERGNMGATLLLEFVTTDRTPSQDVVDALQSLDRPVWRLKEGIRPVIRALSNDGNGLIVGPDAPERDQNWPVGPADDGRKDKVKSDLAYFSAGYRALKLKEFAAAKSIFDEAATLYDMTRHTVYMLPYYAYAAARAGDVSPIEGILGKMKDEQQGPDYFLARAILAAAAGQNDEALKALDVGRCRFLYLKATPIRSTYVYGDISEALAELTGNAKIREFALKYARAFQKIEAWHAWPYAMEARLARNAKDRGRALAMAYYLDPKSEWLSALKKVEIEHAVKTYGMANPFLQRAAQPGKGDKI